MNAKLKKKKQKTPLELVQEGKKREASFSRARAQICYHCCHMEIVNTSPDSSTQGWRCSELGLVFGPDNISTLELTVEMTCNFWENLNISKNYEKEVSTEKLNKGENMKFFKVWLEKEVTQEGHVNVYAEDAHQAVDFVNQQIAVGKLTEDGITNWCEPEYAAKSLRASEDVDELDEEDKRTPKMLL
jgi:hypothetical protein